MGIFHEIPPFALALIHVGPAAWGVFHILLYKRDPRAATGWITVCVFIPFAGPTAYFFFGINRVKNRALGIRRRLLAIGYEAGSRARSSLLIDGSDLRSAGQRITGKAVSSGNRVIPLFNGESAYPRMLESIGNASERVLLSTYILKNGEVGLKFAESLKLAAAKGVTVMVLVDGFGALYSLRSPLASLKKHGVRVARFLPPRLFPPSIYINLRNHRKLLIVDDEVAYTGGMNISDEHTTTSKKPRSITDVHFQVSGPAIDDLAELFYRDWLFATGTAQTHSSAVRNQGVGDMDCRVIGDGPDHEMDALSLTIQTAISSASDSIDIMTPYFLPNRELIGALQSAALRGVLVRVVLPGENNLFYIDWAHRNTLAELLKWDLHIFYQPAPFCHSKLLRIDKDYCLIGSANLDPRSLRLNYELGVEVFSEKLNQELNSHFDETINLSRKVEFEELENRPIRVRLRDSAAALLSPYL